MKGLFDGAANAVDQYLSTILGSATNSVMTVLPEGPSIAGGSAKLVPGLESEYSVTAPVNDVVSISATVMSNGNIDNGRVLTANNAASGTVNVTAVDNGAATTNGGVAHLHVTANTRNGTCVVKVQHSSDNTTFADLVTFTTVGTSTTTSERVVVATGTTVNRYVRAQITPAGSTGAVTTTVAFARR